MAVLESFFVLESEAVGRLDIRSDGIVRLIFRGAFPRFEPQMGLSREEVLWRNYEKWHAVDFRGLLTLLPVDWSYLQAVQQRQAEEMRAAAAPPMGVMMPPPPPPQRMLPPPAMPLAQPMGGMFAPQQGYGMQSATPLSYGGQQPFPSALQQQQQYQINTAPLARYEPALLAAAAAMEEENSDPLPGAEEENSTAGQRPSTLETGDGLENDFSFGGSVEGENSTPLPDADEEENSNAVDSALDEELFGSNDDLFFDDLPSSSIQEEENSTAASAAAPASQVEEPRTALPHPTLGLPTKKRTAETAGLDTSPPAFKRSALGLPTAPLQPSLPAPTQPAPSPQPASRESSSPEPCQKKFLTPAQGSLTLATVSAWGETGSPSNNKFTKPQLQDFLKRGRKDWSQGIWSKGFSKELLEYRVEQTWITTQGFKGVTERDEGGMFEFEDWVPFLSEEVLKSRTLKATSSSSSPEANSEDVQPRGSSAGSNASTSRGSSAQSPLVIDDAAVVQTPSPVRKQGKLKDVSSKGLMQHWGLSTAPTRSLYSDVPTEGATAATSIEIDSEAQPEQSPAAPKKQRKARAPRKQKLAAAPLSAEQAPEVVSERPLEVETPAPIVEEQQEDSQPAAASPSAKSFADTPRPVEEEEYEVYEFDPELFLVNPEDVPSPQGLVPVPVVVDAAEQVEEEEEEEEVQGENEDEEDDGDSLFGESQDQGRAESIAQDGGEEEDGDEEIARKLQMAMDEGEESEEE